MCNHHYVVGEITDKRKFLIQFLSEEIRINHLVVNKTNHQNSYFYHFSLDIKSQQTTYTVTTQDVSKKGLDALFVQECNSLYAFVDEMSNVRCIMNKFIRQNVLALMGNGDPYSIFIGKEGVIGLHAK